MSQGYQWILVRSDRGIAEFYVHVGYKEFEFDQVTTSSMAAYYKRHCVVFPCTVGLRLKIPKGNCQYVQPCLAKLQKRVSFVYDAPGVPS